MQFTHETLTVIIWLSGWVVAVGIIFTWDLDPLDRALAILLAAFGWAPVVLFSLGLAIGAVANQD